MPERTAADDVGRRNVARLGGVAALVGGLAWVVKGTVILGGGDQPPLLLEVAPMLFGVALLSIAYSTLPPSRRRAVALGLAAVSAMAGFVAFSSELVGEVVGMALAISSIALLLGLLLLPRRGPRPAPLAWWIGATTLPALLVGGILSELDERLLEAPLTCLGVAWIVLGWTALSDKVDTRSS
ncbi:hypothetical protein ACFU7D_02010 [Nocardioides sp. NPDC057577]|uniref:hypothetical protein n=1 Tax=Nocardioides sp. NPDC057577 TaxID=3346171 RepID=UPI00366EAA13